MTGWSLPCGHPDWVRPSRPGQDQEQDLERETPAEGGTPKVPHPDLPETPFFDARDVQGQFTQED